MAGYSGTPLMQKLGVKQGVTLALFDAPPHVVTEIPSGVTVKRRASGSADVVVAFFTDRKRLDERLGLLGEMIFPAGGLWVVWPKRSGGVTSDINGDVVRELALPRGLVDNKVCAVDETWSGLRVVWRKELRAMPRVQLEPHLP